MMELHTITPREASIFAAICDTVVAPAGGMPPICETDAAFALDANLAVAPPLNRMGLRVVLHVLELAPLFMGHSKRLRRLDPPARAEVLTRIAHHPSLGALIKGVTAVAHLCYYGDLAVMRSFGYDPDAVVARGAALREKEVRW